MVPRENKKHAQYLCKILEGQTKSIMVFLKVAEFTSASLSRRVYVRSFCYEHQFNKNKLPSQNFTLKLALKVEKRK